MKKLIMTAAVIAAVSTTASAEGANDATIGQRLFDKWNSSTQYNTWGDYSDRKVAAEEAKQEAPVEKAKGKKKRMKKKAKAAAKPAAAPAATPAKK